MKFSFLFSDKFWCLIITLVLFVVAYQPIIANYQNAPADRFYFGSVDEYPIDTTWSLGLIRQGYNGHVLPFLNFSSTLPDSSSLLKIEYTLIGWFAKLIHIDPIGMFYLARFLMSLFYVLVIYRVIAYVFGRPLLRVVAYLFVVFGAGVTISPGTDFVGVSVMDALVTQRLTIAAIHYLLGGLLTIASLYFLSRTLETPSRTRFFLSSIITGAAASLVNGPSMALVISSLPVYVVLAALRLWKSKNGRSRIASQVQVLFAYAVITGLPLVYVRYVMMTVWSQYNFNHSEMLNPFHLTPVQYLFAMGMTFLLSLFAIPRVLKSEKPLLLLLVPWIVMHPVGEYVMPGILHINKIRYFLTPYFVGFGILAAAGTWDVATWFHKRISKLSVVVIVGMVAVAVIGSSYQSIMVAMARARLCYCLADAFAFAYPRRELVNSLIWLGEHSHEDEIVLSQLFTGNLIPVFAGNRVYVSWWQRLLETPNYWDVSYRMGTFYSGVLNEHDAYEFLIQNNITWVLYSPIERANPSLHTLPYPFLDTAYQNGETIVYAVRNPR